METIILKTQKEIRDFLELKNKFNATNFIDTDYNAFITIKGMDGWKGKPFHVYRVETGIIENMIVNDRIQIVSENEYPEKENVVRFVKHYQNKSVYEISVPEIIEIKLVKIKK